MRRITISMLALLATAVAAPVASASQLIDRNATNVELLVNGKGEALLTYRTHGKVEHVLAWGAIDALPPTADANQVELELDYQGGWKKHYVDDPAVRKLQAAYHELKSSGKPYLASPVVKNLAAKATYAKSYW